MTAVNLNRAIRGPVTAVPIVAGKGVRLVADTQNNRWVVEADETVLWEGTKSAVNDTITLSEAASNFDTIRFYAHNNDAQEPWLFVGKITTQSAIQVVGYSSGNTWDYQWGSIKLGISSSNTLLSIVKNACFYLLNNSIGKSNDLCVITKIVGVNRIASN